MSPRLVGNTIKAVLEMSIVDFALAAPLIAKGTITHGGWTVCVETNDPLDMTTETQEQLSALVACASANGYQIGQTYKWVRVKRKVNQGAQKFVRRMCEPPRGLAAWLPSINASLKSLYKDMQTAMYQNHPLLGLKTDDYVDASHVPTESFFGVSRTLAPIGTSVGSAVISYKVP